jgi:cellulose synthase/poly-beta-1,6-N-acetylglucosamine synthase-like glycosyltransferase
MVSIIIPSRNEQNFIGKCLDSVIAQSYGKDLMEVLVVDGMSGDKTREIVGDYCRRYPFVRLIDNPQRATPYAFNIGIAQAKGDFIMILSSHSECGEDFVLNGVAHLSSTADDVVGGPIITLPGADTFVARGIALITSHPFGVGNSKFRTTNRKGYVDTVPFGIYRRDVFRKVGGFNEKLARNQDNEMSDRIIKSGGRIYFTPDLTATYYNQPTVSGLVRQAVKTGMWNIITLKISKTALSWRHFVPLIFVVTLLAFALLAPFHESAAVLLLVLLGSYGGAAVVSSFQIGLRSGMRYVWFLPLLFFLYHVSYGIGSLRGLIRLIGGEPAGQRSAADNKPA